MSHTARVLLPVSMFVFLLVWDLVLWKRVACLPMGGQRNTELLRAGACAVAAIGWAIAVVVTFMNQ